MCFDPTGPVVQSAEFREPEAEGGLIETLRWRLNRRWERLWGK